MTEESVETLFDLGLEHLIVGVSSFVKRPVEAQKLPKVTQFTRANIDKILELKPDLVVGFSDIQKDIARDLIGAGVDVYISNQRSIDEILNYILMLGSMLGESDKATKYVQKLEDIIQKARANRKMSFSPIRTYFEEWDDPAISAIQWVGEIIEISGGENIFSKKATQSMAKDRIVNFDEVVAKDPQIIFGCWCGKSVNIDEIKSRKGWSSISAVKNNQVYELQPEIFLQPGPAPIIDGISILTDYFKHV